jgi:hypothetical protein
MGFTAPVITHTWENADGTPASGSVTCSLTARMTNGTTSIVPAEITANLNSSGVLSQSLTSNCDAATTPPNAAQWKLDFRIQGAQLETFYIVVPPIVIETDGATESGQDTVALSSQTANTNMIGQSITGTNIPADTTITGVLSGTNGVTMSANATGSGTGLTLTIGATIDLGQLLPETQQVN